MKLLVIGASRGTGLELTKKGLRAGHHVTALSRSADQFSLASSRLTHQRGDFHAAADMDSAVPGHDAVIITASLPMAQLWQAPTFYSTGTAQVLAAMVRHGVPKIVILSNMAAGDGLALLNPLEKLFTRIFIADATADHTRQEQLARDSGLTWVVVRPSRLTNGAPRSRYQALVRQRVPSSIARADVATFLLEAATTSHWDKQTVNIGG